MDKEKYTSSFIAINKSLLATGELMRRMANLPGIAGSNFSSLTAAMVEQSKRLRDTTGHPMTALARRLQQLRVLKEREYEHCKYSSSIGCWLLKGIATAYYYNKYNQRSYRLKTFEDCQQEAFLAMLENKHKYKEGCPAKFIHLEVGNHFKEVFRAANIKARAIDNNRYRGKVKYINPGLCSINSIVFNTWDVDLMLTKYISCKAGGNSSRFIFLSEQDKVFLKGELLEDMMQAVEQLPDLQRDIVKMYYLQDMNIKDICNVLHISTAKEQRTRREAIRALRAQLFNEPVFNKLIMIKQKIKKQPPLNNRQLKLIHHYNNFTNWCIDKKNYISFPVNQDINKDRPGICSGSSFFPRVRVEINNIIDSFL